MIRVEKWKIVINNLCSLLRHSDLLSIRKAFNLWTHSLFSLTITSSIPIECWATSCFSYKSFSLFSHISLSSCAIRFSWYFLFSASWTVFFYIYESLTYDVRDSWLIFVRGSKFSHMRHETRDDKQIEISFLSSLIHSLQLLQTRTLVYFTVCDVMHGDDWNVEWIYKEISKAWWMRKNILAIFKKLFDHVTWFIEESYATHSFSIHIRESASGWFGRGASSGGMDRIYSSTHTNSERREGNIWE